MVRVSTSEKVTKRYASPDGDDVEVVFGDDNSPNYRNLYNFDPTKFGSDDDVTEFFDDNGSRDDGVDDENPNRIFFDAKKEAVLNQGVHEIPGSPWAKPANRPSSRPTEPLALARWASALALGLAVGFCIYIFVNAIWNYSSVGRVIIEIFLGKHLMSS